MVSITQSELRKNCVYDPVNGGLIWSRSGKKRNIGQSVGSVGTHGYLETSVNRNRYLVHRLVWLWHHGRFPPDQLDHTNNDRLDNRIENLRLATNQQNNFNQGKRKNASSTYRGVSWEQRRSIWKAVITCGGKGHWIGYFESEREAALAWNKAAKELYGEYAYQNIVGEEDGSTETFPVPHTQRDSETVSKGSGRELG